MVSHSPDKKYLFYAPDHSWPDLIDHTKTELSDCCCVIYVKCNLPGQMWLRCLVFANRIRISVIP
jgi:hypothetical protein